MNTYLIKMRNDEESEQFIAETASKAKYMMFKLLSNYFEWYDGFMGFLREIDSCKMIHKHRISDLFVDDEHFEKVKHHRNIDFVCVGMKISVNGRSGVVCGANNSMNLDVCFDGETYKQNCHPYWRTKYFDTNGMIIKSFDGN